jgi:hypothetical protein
MASAQTNPALWQSLFTNLHRYVNCNVYVEEHGVTLGLHTECRRIRRTDTPTMMGLFALMPSIVLLHTMMLLISAATQGSQPLDHATMHTREPQLYRIPLDAPCTVTATGVMWRWFTGNSIVVMMTMPNAFHTQHYYDGVG